MALVRLVVGPLMLAAVTAFIFRRRLLTLIVSSSRSSITSLESEAKHARRTDLTLLGYLLANRLVADGTCPMDSGFAQIWRSRIVPNAVREDCAWQLGMTAAIAGLTSAAGIQFNGLVGRIAERNAADGRWQLMVKGPNGVGTVNVKSQNLKAASDISAIIAVWRDVPNRSQLRDNGEPKADRRALHAVARRDGRELREIVRAGGDLCSTDAQGRTALHLALEMLAEWTELASDACVPCEHPQDAWSQLMSDAASDDAPRAGQMALVRELLDARDSAHLNARDRQQRTPLLAAVRAGLHDVVDLLLEAHADPTLTDSRGNNCLHEATIRGDAETVKLLLHAPRGSLDLEARGQGRWTPLGLAARSGNLAVAEALLTHGADPDAEAFLGKSSLDVARGNGREAMCVLLSKRTPTTTRNT